jgi:ribosome-binding protein aMBF1 (putative translation factor)
MIIKNDEQYQNSLNYLHKFEQSVTEIEKNESLKQEPTRYNLYKDSYQSQVDEFKQDIAEYERLINCNQSQPITIKVESFNKLPDVLIKARIAAKLSHKELANILSIEEDRVKEYEESDYQCASFVEILEVSAALGVEFKDATVKVDFEEIEEGKKSSTKWRQWREQKNIVKTKAS